MRAACESYEQIGLYRLFSKRKQLSKAQRSYPASGIAPCTHACDGKRLVRAVAPQSAAASSSLLRQPA
jgi:hypothetical protein